jgi:hypothetical protein
MAQRSLPQAGTGVGDSGPYTSDQWAELFQTVFTGDQQATQGPVRHALNELEVTEAALAVTTATGVGFVYGHWLINDAAVAINIALAAGGLERWDRVVMIQNNTAAAYNTNLALPGAYAAGVPRNSARIAILQGAEAGAAVLPPLLVGPNYYMVELARYFVNDAAVGAVTDYRDYCGLGASGPGTQYIWVSAEAGYNVSEGQSIPVTSSSGDVRVLMPTGQQCNAFGRFTTPGNYLSTAVVQAVIYTSPAGNLRCRQFAHIGACGIDPATVIDSNVTDGVPVASGILQCVRDLSLSPLAQGDIIKLWFIRHGNDGYDTCLSVRFYGWLVSYTTLT